jgi:hypothetical protein
MTEGQIRLGRVALTLSLLGLVLVALQALATRGAPVFLMVCCVSIPLGISLELVALVCGVMAAQTHSGKFAVGIACLSLGLFGGLIVPWYLTGPHTIGP